MGNIILVENSAASTKMELYEDVNKAGEKELGPSRSSRLLHVAPVTPRIPHMLVFLAAFSIPAMV